MSKLRDVIQRTSKIFWGENIDPEENPKQREKKKIVIKRRIQERAKEKYWWIPDKR